MRERRKIISNFLGISFLTAAVFFMTVYIHAATNPTTSVINIYAVVNDSKIYIQKVNEEWYLFLPSGTDDTSFALKSDKSNQKVLFVVDGRQTEELLFQDIKLTERGYSVLVNVLDSEDKNVDSFSLRVMKGSGIGTVYFSSADKESKGRDWVDKDRDNHTEGTVIVTDSSGSIINKASKNRMVTDLHGRGNTSWLDDPKKSYQIKFDKKISLIDEAAEAKKWLLLAQYKDPLRMNDKIVKDIGNAVCERYSPREIWVNFYYDGEYRGVYLLSEKIEVTPGRVDITDMEEYYERQDPAYGQTMDLKKDTNKYGNSYQYQEGLTGPADSGSFLIETNDTTWDKDNGFKFRIGTIERAVNIRSPELGSKEAVKFISEYFQEFCDAVTNSDYTGKNPETGLYYYDYCNPDSLVDSYLIQSIASNKDSYWKSQFFYKDAGKKMYAGPLWDMDLTFGTGWRIQIEPDKDFLTEMQITKDLIQIPDFRKKVKSKYFESYSGILESLADTGKLVSSFADSYNLIKDDLAMDTILWPVRYKCGSGKMEWNDSDTLEDIVNYRIQWIKDHKAYLDTYFGSM